MTPPNPKTPLTKSTLAIGFAALAASLASLQAQSVWDGGGTTNNWSDGPNWTADTAPVSDSTTQIQLSGSTRLSPVVDSPYTLQSLTFNSGAGAFTLSGSAITISAASGQPNRIINNSANTQTIGNAINLSGAGLTAAQGDMILNGNLTIGGNGIRMGAGAGKTLTINGPISGSISGDNFAINASGTVALNNGASSYTSQTSIWNGTVVAGGNAPAVSGTTGVFGNSSSEINLGVGAVTLNPALLIGGAYNIGRNIRVNSTATASTYTIGGSTADTSVLSGTITNGQNSQAAQAMRVTAAASGRVNITGNIVRATGATGSADHLTKIGGGIVALEGSNNTYSGTTTVSAGTLLVNGTLTSGGGTVSVNTNATLGGDGIIGRGVSISSGGTLSPGDMSGLISLTGILSVDGNVTLNDGAIFAGSLNGATVGTQYDQLNIGGSGVFSLTGTNSLTLNLGFTPGFGQQFTLVDIEGGAAVTGVFEQLNGVTTDLSQGAFFTLGGTQFQISYTAEGTTFSGAGNNVMLQVVPEPGSALIFGYGICFLLFRIGRRRLSVRSS
jgi:autotransporter-associated beta strand protein